jgi:hypothetical protein
MEVICGDSLKKTLFIGINQKNIDFILKNHPVSWEING